MDNLLVLRHLRRFGFIFGSGENSECEEQRAQ